MNLKSNEREQILKMTRVVINACYGGFGLSEEAVMLYEKRSGKAFHRYLPRDDGVLVQVVEELGDRASDHYSKLEVVHIPEYIEWSIKESDGKEWICKNE